MVLIPKRGRSGSGGRQAVDLANAGDVATVRAAGDPGVSASSSAFGGAGDFAAAAADISDTFLGVASRARAAEDAGTVTEAEIKAKDFIYEYSNHEETGAYGKLGSNARGITEGFKTGYEKLVTDMKVSDMSPRVQEAINSRLSALGDSARGALSRHERGQQIEHTNGKLEAAQSIAARDAAANFTDPAIVQSNLNDMADAVLDQATINGWSEDKTALVFQEQSTAFHTGVVVRMVDANNPMMAADYLLNNKAEMTPASFDKLRSDVLGANSTREAQLETDSIMAKGLSFPDALAAARGINDPDKRDDVLKRVKTRFQEGEKNRLIEARQAGDTAVGIIEAGKSLDDVPLDVRNKLSPDAISKLGTRANRIANGLPVKTDLNDYASLARLETENLDGFLKSDLHEFQLSADDFKKFADRQRAYGAKENNQKVLVSSRAELIKRNALRYGLEPNAKPGTEDARRYGSFVAAVDDAALAEGLTKPSELQPVIDRLMIEGRDTGTGAFGFFQDTKFRFEEMSEGGAFVIPIEDIPKADVLNIKAAFYSDMGREPSDTEISDMYQAGLDRAGTNARQEITPENVADAANGLRRSAEDF